MTSQELNVCARMLFMHAAYICIHTSSLHPIGGCDWLRVWVCFSRVGGCRKDTLTSQSLDFSSRQAHRDLEFSRMTVCSPKSSITLKTKDREVEAVSSANTNPFHVWVINKVWKEWTEKGWDVLEVIKLAKEGEKMEIPQFSCCCLKVIEFLIDFSQFYFKSIKSGWIA